MSVDAQALENEATALVCGFVTWAETQQPACNPYAIALAAIKLAATTTAALKIPLDAVNSTYLEQRNRADEAILNRRKSK